MECCFFIHGKPLSTESTARSVFDGFEKQICDEFFSSVFSDRFFMSCEIRKWKSSLYSVYSYYVNGIDYAGRSNGYCVLTLIVKGRYSIRPSKIYGLMDDAYKKGLQQTLKFIDGNGRYLINSLNDNLSSLGILENDVYTLLNENDFRTIDNATTNGGVADSRVERFNPIDADSEACLSVLLRQGKVYVSSNYLSNSQRLSEQEVRLQSLNDEFEILKENKTKLEHDLVELRKHLIEERKISSMNVGKQKPDSVDDLKNENLLLKQENDILNSKISSLEKQVNDSGLSKTKNNSDENLLVQFRRIFNYNGKLEILPLLNTILLFFCLWGIFNVPAQGLRSKDVLVNKERSEKIDSLKNVIKNKETKMRNMQRFANDGEIMLPQEITNGKTLKLVVRDMDASIFKWSIIEGNECATIEDYKITGKKSGKVKVKCEYEGIVKTKEITIKN